MGICEYKCIDPGSIDYVCIVDHLNYTIQYVTHADVFLLDQFAR